MIFRAASALPGLTPGVGIASVSALGYAGFLLSPPLIGGISELTSLPVARARSSPWHS